MLKAAAVERFVNRVQTLIPAAQEKYDASHASIIYFCALSLALLKSSRFPKQDYDEYTKGLWCGNGYKGSTVYNTSPDEASVAATYFCLAIRVMSGLELPSESEKDEIVVFLKECQTHEGSFRALRQGGEPSMRHTYSAIAALSIIDRLDASEAWIRSAGDYIISLQNYEGGFGERVGDESHGGLTYCAAATLALCGRTNDLNLDSLYSFLAHRQNPTTGGFNGRPHKPDDVCYAFWTLASLSLFAKSIGDDARRMARDFLTGPGYDTLLGGFVKSAGSHADIYHTALGLGALSLSGENGLAPLDSALTVVWPTP